jgi:hypothetical protein
LKQENQGQVNPVYREIAEQYLGINNRTLVTLVLHEDGYWIGFRFMVDLSPDIIKSLVSYVKL